MCINYLPSLSHTITFLSHLLYYLHTIHSLHSSSSIISFAPHIYHLHTTFIPHSHHHTHIHIHTTTTTLVLHPHFIHHSYHAQTSFTCSYVPHTRHKTIYIHTQLHRHICITFASHFINETFTPSSFTPLSTTVTYSLIFTTHSRHFSYHNRIVHAIFM